MKNDCVDISFPDEPDEDDEHNSRDNGDELLMPDENDLGDRIMPDIAEEERRKRDNGE